jgi:hypothetical protein
MQNGVYRVIFRGPVGEGRGVIAAKGGALWGGDTGFVYQGSYAAEDGKASIQVKKDDPNFPGVFGPLNDFRLDLTLQVTTSGFIAVGAVPGQPCRYIRDNDVVPRKPKELADYYDRLNAHTEQACDCQKPRTKTGVCPSRSILRSAC